MKRKNIKKGNKLHYAKLDIQNYLISDKLTTHEAKLLFKIRTNMLDFRVNFKSKYGKGQITDEYLLCPICKNHVDNEENIFICSELRNVSNAKFNDIFSNDMNLVAKTIKQFQKLWNARKSKM